MKHKEELELKERIFSIRSQEEFVSLAIDVFRYQVKYNEVYRKFVEYLNTDVGNVEALEQIPFLPIELFKKHHILDRKDSPELYFLSSGTTLSVRSKHYIVDHLLYEKSVVESFSLFLSSPKDYIFLGLLPSYQEKGNSSLIYMVDYLMQLSGKKENGYFLYDHTALKELLKSTRDKKVLLFGVSYALLDFIENEPEVKDLDLSNLIVMETGGMKGRKEEMTKDALLKELKEGFGIQTIYSEYSMTELLSQAYSLGENKYQSPPWMKILIRNSEDPLSYMAEGRTGGINIIDLANLHSASFIATQDLGRITGSYFEVLGRIDHADIRGCSLLLL